VGLLQPTIEIIQNCPRLEASVGKCHGPVEVERNKNAVVFKNGHNGILQWLPVNSDFSEY
jgi:hypothetical protein